MNIDGVMTAFTIFLGDTPSLLTTLIIYTTIIALYSVFVFYFYRFLAKKNIIELNLAKYNLSQHPGWEKFFAVVFYIIEYLILLPVLTFLWFAVLSILLLVLAEGVGVSTALIISAALVASVRVTSYLSENLSKDLAKMLPFTLLAIAVTKPGFFQVATLIGRMQEIPLLFKDILYYLAFIAGIELVMRLTSMIKNAMTNREGELGTQSEE